MATRPSGPVFEITAVAPRWIASPWIMGAHRAGDPRRTPGRPDGGVGDPVEDDGRFAAHQAPTLVADEDVAVPDEDTVERGAVSPAAPARARRAECLTEQLAGAGECLLRHVLFGQQLVSDVAHPA